MDSRGHGLNHDGRYHTACQIKGQSDSRHRDVVSCGGRCEFHRAATNKHAACPERNHISFIHHPQVVWEDMGKELESELARGVVAVNVRG